MSMRCPRNLDVYRRTLQGERGDDMNGIMYIPARYLSIMFANGGGWEHVSVSRTDRTPTWEEMEWVKRAFWDETDTVMQLHVPPTEHVDYHPHCLHLWRPLDVDIPRPPTWMVA
jgi:hypothetical protein